MKSIIFAIVLVGAAFALEDVKTVVKRIDSTAFGKTLLDTIYL
jgi:hypothetical protein